MFFKGKNGVMAEAKVEQVKLWVKSKESLFFYHRERLFFCGLSSFFIFSITRK